MARPREFDETEALDRALDLMWSKGYAASSVDELCAAAELSRSSFYGTFGDKRTLLIRALDRYVERRNPTIVAAFSGGLPIRRALAAFLDGIIEDIVRGPGRRGCFLGNCAAELPRSDRTALARVRSGLEQTERAFREALSRAGDELPAGADAGALARFLTAGVQGLRLVGKANPDRATLKDIAETLLSCLERAPQTGKHKGEDNRHDDQTAPARTGT